MRVFFVMVKRLSLCVERERDLMYLLGRERGKTYFHSEWTRVGQGDLKNTTGTTAPQALSSSLKTAVSTSQGFSNIGQWVLVSSLSTTNNVLFLLVVVELVEKVIHRLVFLLCGWFFLDREGLSSKSQSDGHKNSLKRPNKQRLFVTNFVQSLYCACLYC